MDPWVSGGVGEGLIDQSLCSIQIGLPGTA